MREILFRGETEKGEWVYGDLLHPDNCGNGYSIEDFTKDKNACFDVIPETVGQYTGLTDKNGKRIFEGDYWVDTDDGENDIFVVEFRNGQFCFAIYGICGALMPYGYDETAGGFGECDCVPMADYYTDKIEIIVNVHDNPELIGGGEDA